MQLVASSPKEWWMVNGFYSVTWNDSWDDAAQAKELDPVILVGLFPQGKSKSAYSVILWTASHLHHEKIYWEPLDSFILSILAALYLS